MPLAQAGQLKHAVDIHPMSQGSSWNEEDLISSDDGDPIIPYEPALDRKMAIQNEYDNVMSRPTTLYVQGIPNPEEVTKNMPAYLLTANDVMQRSSIPHQRKNMSHDSHKPPRSHV